MSLRFSSLQHAPAETRIRLRDRFSRFLPAQFAGRSVHQSANVVLRDEDWLNLLLHLNIAFGNDESLARDAYVIAAQEHTDQPSFEDMADDHWCRIIWGRISVSFPVSQAARARSEGLVAFNAFLETRFTETISFDPAVQDKTEVSSIATAVEKGEMKLNSAECQCPEWVAARLWDRAPRLANKSARLRLWIDRWRILGCPYFDPVDVWAEADAFAFWEATLEVLEVDAGLPDWHQTRTAFVGQIALIQNRPASEVDASFPQVPDTLIGRALWLEGPSVERLMMDTVWSTEDISGATSLALTWIEGADHSQAPHPFAARLLELAIDRADLFQLLLFRLRSHPKLLADVLLHPPTSALACMIVGRWESPGGAWDRELTSKDDEASKAVAFADAVSVMSWFLQQGSLAPSEASALLVWIYRRMSTGFIDDRQEPMLTVMRGELSGQSSEILREMADHLISIMPESAVGGADFAAALDIIDLGSLAKSTDPLPLVNAYQRSLSAGGYGLTARTLGQGACSALLDLTALNKELRHSFLYPFDVKRLLAKGTEETFFALEEGLCRSLRVHIRVLCRAIIGSTETSPEGLVEALVFAVKSGALKHLEKGRLPAFAPRHEVNIMGTSSDRPIAADLGAVLSVLWGDQRSQLLAAVLETDEPMMLAQLLGYLPAALRPIVRSRIESIRPEDVGETHSLFEAQARIEALLSGGASEAASRFIKEEEGLQTLGQAPGRELARLRSDLRLLLIEGKWSAIAEFALPIELTASHDTAASDTLYFYKALAALNDPQGNKNGAEETFARLQDRRPDVAAYAINLFAARISIMLAGNFFEELTGEALRRGNQLLSTAEEIMRRTRAASPEDVAVFNSNKAVLLLALRRPRAALELLTSLPGNRAEDTSSAYTAIALARLGQTAEALARLDQAKQMTGDSAILSAARAHIESGQAFAAVAIVSTNEDPIPRIQRALWELSQLDPIQQANALRSAPNGFFTFVTDQVRYAAASLTGLVPMMQSISLEGREDDLNALIGQLLASRIHFLNWVVPDQTRGGFTAAGNPGERDLVLRRDSAELAVIEAVICENSIDSGNLTEHFKKLFTYGSCRLFFHLTYSYLNDRLEDLMQRLKQIASQEAPAQFIYRDLQVLSSEDSRPTGFVARYAVENDEAKVVFLVLDMGQHTLRNAAKALVRH